jgi:UDP-N-acetylmuramoyl-L-alanyl-D-glutamate--2,6-diaminopimelate ligase
MKLGELLAGVSAQLAEIEVAGLEYDSRRVEPGYLFFAFVGERADGRRFAGEAVKKGAVAVVSEAERPSDVGVPWVRVPHGRQALAAASRNFYQHPDERIALTGITGTNGKTTTCYVSDSILRAAGKTTGLIGTIEYRLAGRVLPAVNTTPESLDVMRLLAELERAGGSHMTMEVSSHALALGRVHGFQFQTAVFTNLTRDHLDFHGTMEAYGAAKRMLFAPSDAAEPRFAVINADDPAGQRMVASGSEVIWYGLSGAAELRAKNIRSGFGGLTFDLSWRGASVEVASTLGGRINVYNILAAAGVGLSHGLDLDTIRKGVANCRAVPGRFERVDAGQPFLVVVDYAHTDDALRNVITVARELAGNKGRVITLFGCGGDRDRTKRPLMGMAAAELSDFVVLTSDNPRSEDPLGIMNDAMVGIRRFDTPHIAEPDRTKAIQRALQEARPHDVVLLAGKGHESYQVLQGRTIDFDDRKVARDVLGELGYREKPE